MDENLFKRYLQKGEGETIEFKQTLNSEAKIAKTICALANTSGGVILVGVKDNKEIIGVDPEEEKHVLSGAAEFYCKPPVPLEIEEIYIPDEEEEEGQEKIILKVRIRESASKPHYVLTKDDTWVPYLRQQDKTLIAGAKAVSQMQTTPVRSGDLSNNERRLIKYLEVNDRITLKQYTKLVNISERRARRELNDALDKGLVRVLEHEKEDYYVL